MMAIDQTHGPSSRMGSVPVFSKDLPFRISVVWCAVLPAVQPGEGRSDVGSGFPAIEGKVVQRVQPVRWVESPRARTMGRSIDLGFGCFGGSQYLDRMKVPRVLQTPAQETVVVRVRASRTRGYILRALTCVVQRAPWGHQKLAAEAGLHSLRDLDLADRPTTLPVLPMQPNLSDGSDASERELILPHRSEPRASGYKSYYDFHEAYKTGKQTPLEVAERLLASIQLSQTGSQPLNAFLAWHRDDVLAQARASTERYSQRAWLSELDGVPVVVKGETDVQGYESLIGTAFAKSPARDAYTVEKFRAKGAVIVGKSVMQELGWDTFSMNPIQGTPRNPYNLNHSCGGSSGGSACAVAAGFCPIAIGADSGGSVRIPAAFCGVYALKPTLGRISSRGGYPLGSSLECQGPIACSADDLAMAYWVMAGVDVEDPSTHLQPAPTLRGLRATASLAGVRVGVFPAWNSHVQNRAITARVTAFAHALEEKGAEVVEISIPELERARVAHLVTLCAERSAFVGATLGRRAGRKLMCPSRVLMRVSESLTAGDYFRAQQIRTRIIRHLHHLFHPSSAPSADPAARGIDLILTPTSPTTSPRLPTAFDAPDTPLTSDAMRFGFLANLAGIPAVSVPVGLDDEGLPVGMQMMAEWWNEALLLRMARACEEVYEGSGGGRGSEERWKIGELV